MFIRLSLWYSLTGTLLVEGGMFILATIQFFNTATAKDKTGTFAFFLPIPWLFVLWACWINRQRTERA